MSFKGCSATNQEKKSKSKEQTSLTIGFMIELNKEILEEIRENFYVSDFSKAFKNKAYSSIYMGDIFSTDTIQVIKNNFKYMNFYSVCNNILKNGEKNIAPLYVNFDSERYNPYITSIAENSLTKEEIISMNKNYFLDTLYKLNRGEVFNFDFDTFKKYIHSYNIFDNLGSEVLGLLSKINRKYFEGARFVTPYIKF